LSDRHGIILLCATGVQKEVGAMRGILAIGFVCFALG